MSMNVELEVADECQKAFMTLREWARLLSAAALLLEVILISLSFVSLLIAYETMMVWKPMVALSLAVGAHALRSRSETNRRKSQKFRREAMKAAAYELDPDRSKVASDLDQIPKSASRYFHWLCGIISATEKSAASGNPTPRGWLAWAYSKLPDTLRYLEPNCLVFNYYGPMSSLPAKGPLRLRRLVSYSTYFTWKLSEFKSKYLKMFLVVLSILISAFVLLAYSKATAVGVPQNSTTTQPVTTASSSPSALTANNPEKERYTNLVFFVEFFYGLLIGELCIRLYKSHQSAGGTAKECERIANRLLEAKNPTDEQLQSIVFEYDIERIVGSEPSLLMYAWHKDEVEEDWKRWSLAL
jgi:hypothetical protein